MAAAPLPGLSTRVKNDVYRIESSQYDLQDSPQGSIPNGLWHWYSISFKTAETLNTFLQSDVFQQWHNLCDGYTTTTNCVYRGVDLWVTPEKSTLFETALSAAFPIRINKQQINPPRTLSARNLKILHHLPKLLPSGD